MGCLRPTVSPARVLRNEGAWVWSSGLAMGEDDLNHRYDDLVEANGAVVQSEVK